jgi:hypothetical protein
LKISFAKKEVIKTAKDEENANKLFDVPIDLLENLDFDKLVNYALITTIHTGVMKPEIFPFSVSILEKVSSPYLDEKYYKSVKEIEKQAQETIPLGKDMERAFFIAKNKLELIVKKLRERSKKTLEDTYDDA